MFAIVGLFDGTQGRRERKEDDSQQYQTVLHLCRKMAQCNILKAVE
jgi:hypothetical protein